MASSDKWTVPELSVQAPVLPESCDVNMQMLGKRMNMQVKAYTVVGNLAGVESRMNCVCKTCCGNYSGKPSIKVSAPAI